MRITIARRATHHEREKLEENGMTANIEKNLLQSKGKTLKEL